MISLSQVKTLLRREYGLQCTQLKDLNGHIDKVLLVTTKLKKYVLKISLNKRMTKTIFENQLNLMGYLSKNGIEMPKIIKTVQGKDYSVASDYKKRYCILYEFVSGKNIIVENKKQAIDLAKWVAKIHKLCLDFKGKPLFYYNPVEVEIYKTNYISKYIKRTHREFTLPMLNLRKKIVAEYQKNVGKLRSGIFINDLAQSNIVIKNGQKYILDFNIAGGNYLVDDLSWILAWYFLEKGRKELVKKFIDVYQKEIKLNNVEKKILKMLPILYFSLQYKHFAKIENEIKIYDAVPNDGKGLVRVSRITWVATYPNKKLGITVKDLGQRAEFEKGRIKRWRKSIKENKNRKTWVAKVGEEVIGFCGASKDNGIHEIGAIYVLPKYQGRGVGKELIYKAFDWLGNSRDIIVKVVSYNKPSIKFYESVGFKKMGDVKKSEWHKLPTGKLLPEIVMKKKKTAGLKITMAKTTDSTSILKLNNLLDPDELKKKEKIKQSIKNGLVWVVKDGTNIVGYCLAQLFDAKHEQLPNSIFIADLYVMEMYRNQGTGKMLVQKALEKEYPSEYTYFSVTHDPEEKHLTDFYKSFGFEVDGKTKAGNIKMIKQI